MNAPIEPVEIDGQIFGRGVWKTRAGEKAVIFRPSRTVEGRFDGLIGSRKAADQWCANGIWSVGGIEQSKDDIVGVWKR